MRAEAGTGAENKNFKRRIAALGRIRHSEVNQAEAVLLYELYKNAIPMPEPLVEKYLGAPITIRVADKDREDKIMQRVLGERAQQFSQLVEALYDLPPTFLSYGLFAPSYMAGLQIQHEKTPPTRIHRSLLIGALTPDMINEYATSVRTVYPKAECYVTDIEGEETIKVDPKRARFVYGNAQKLPFVAGAFDSVHTTNLLDETHDTKNFFEQTHRVLSDTGILLMVEHKRYTKISDLEEAGFSEVTRYPAISFASRRDLERRLTSGETGKQYQLERYPSPNYGIVLATK